MPPIWRFLLAVVAIFVVQILAAAIVTTGFVMAGATPRTEPVLFWQSLMAVVLMLAVFKIMLATFDHRPLGSMGLAFHPRWGKELGLGLALGAAMILLVALAEWAGGYARFTFAHHSIVPGGLFALCLFVPAAVYEEIIFRGYAFQRLMEAITPAGAVLVVSILFGLVHLWNPHRTWISTANTMLVGVLFCIAYLRTRALWLPIGVHFVWNFLQGYFLGLPVSGLNLTSHFLSARVSGQEYLTGGTYGPEGSVITTAVLIVATAGLAFSKRIRATEEMKSLIATPLPSGEQERAISIFPPQENKEESGGTR